MSGVSPSDLSYFGDTISDYQRRFQELEEEQSGELKKVKEDRDEEVEELEERQEARLREIEKEGKKAVNEAKASGHEALENERKLAKLQIEENKKEMYDRFGRQQKELVETKRQHADEIATLAERSLVDDDGRAKIEKHYEEKLEQRAREGEKEVERAIASHIEATRGESKDLVENQKKTFEHDRRELQESYRRLGQELADEAAFNRKEALRATQTTEDDFESLKKIFSKSNDEKLRELSELWGQQARNEAGTIKEKMGEQIQDLRSQLSQASDFRDPRAVGFAKGREEAIRELESRWKSNERSIQSSYAHQLAEVKRDADRLEGHLREINEENRIAAQQRSAKVIADQNLANRKIVNALGEDHRKEKASIEGRIKQQNEKHQKDLDRAVDRNRQAQERIVEAQNKTFQNTLSRQREEYQSQIDYLKDQVIDAKSSDDPFQISPAAEKNLRQTYFSEHQKVLEREQERSDLENQGLRDEFVKRYRELDHANRVSNFKTKSRHASEIQKSNQRFVDYSNDLEFQKNQQIHNKELDHQKELDGLARIQKEALDQQRYQLLGQIETMREASEIAMRDQRQESEFKMKTIQREHRVEIGRLRREFDRNFSEQKLDYEALIQEIKAKGDKDRQKIIKENKTKLDDQRRIYEHQISQLEAQQEQKRALISENYEDQIESLRRANARLAKKS